MFSLLEKVQQRTGQRHYLSPEACDIFFKFVNCNLHYPGPILVCVWLCSFNFLTNLWLKRIVELKTISNDNSPTPPPQKKRRDVPPLKLQILWANADSWNKTITLHTLFPTLQKTFGCFVSLQQLALQYIYTFFRFPPLNFFFFCESITDLTCILR